MGQHFAVKSGNTIMRHVVAFTVIALAILSVLAFVFSGTAFADEPSDDHTEDALTSTNDEQGSGASQSDNDITVPSVTESPIQV